LQAYAAQQVGLQADDIQQDVPATQNVIKVCHWFPDHLLTEVWMQLWQRALIRSLVSHLLCHPRVSGQIDSSSRERLKNASEVLIRSFSAHVSVYSQIDEIINSSHSRNHLEQYLSNPKWPEFETLISQVLEKCEPLCFYLDATDEAFSSAPMYWLRCHKGLFYQVMRLLSGESRIGSRLRVYFCMRDLVLASIYRDEGAARFRGEPHIRTLTWTRQSIEYFLNQKLQQLDGQFFLRDPKDGRSLSTWLGISHVIHDEGGPPEPILRYALRHTRLLPRDIVILGNMLCHTVTGFKLGHEADLEHQIRRTIREAARIFGNEQLSICANELMAGGSGIDQPHRRKHDTLVGSTGHLNSVADQLKVLVRFVGVARFPLKRLTEAIEHAKTVFGGELDPFSVMWMNGLVGYVERTDGAEKHVFCSDDRMDEFHLPLMRQFYVFHPILNHTVDLRHNGRHTVLPFEWP
jgi:hypothetical protein